jgi:hypothetical protein
LRNDADVQLPLARAVELAKEDALPAAKRELACLHKNELAGTDKSRFHVRVGVAFGVAIRTSCGDQPVERSFYVRSDIGISVLVDGNGGSGVRDKEVADSRGDTRARHNLLDCGCDVDELGAELRFDSECFDQGRRLLDYGMRITK